ncbi:MAG: signal peptidase I [Spirochaetia bacterium]|nr:signal peptidase I [Spirochaetia bacterium]
MSPNYVEWSEVIYWSLFAALTIGEILVVYVYKLDKKHVVRDWVEPAFEAIIIATVLRVFIIQAFAIPTSSMEDTLLIGDHPMAVKCAYGVGNPINGKRLVTFKKPKRGDVVIFRDPTKQTASMWIKRCIALAGDRVEVKDKALYLNGVRVNEPYVVHKDPKVYPASLTYRDNFGPITVPAGSVFLMGDNRDFSYDSRFWGFIDEDKLKGRAAVVYWPPQRIKVIKQWRY